MRPDGTPPEARKIIHIDMDAFFASVEQRDNPELRGKPVAVGGARERGVVAAASYEARTFGVRSAMPSVTARRKCPDLIFAPPRFEVYREVSKQIRAIFETYTPIIEPLSLDEAYLDVTDHLGGLTATEIAKEIRAKIKAATDLTASAGVSYNKFLAKLASDQNKPNGLCVITPKQGPDFVARLEVKRFHGVGPATTEKMHRLGLMVGADIKNCSLDYMTTHFGTSGRYYYNIAHGIDHRPVQANTVRKSIGAENTFFHDLFDYDAAASALYPIIDKVWYHVEKNHTKARTITLKAKFSDFKQLTRSRTLDGPVIDRETLMRVSLGLLSPIFPASRGIRLLGVTLSFLDDGASRLPKQLSLDL